MPTVLCPIDFSEASRGALRYAVVIAAQTGRPVTVMTVNDPLLVQAAEMARGPGVLDREARAETERFLADTFTAGPPATVPSIRISTGAPEAEILRAVAEEDTDLIVMSSRGATGLRKMFLGSTTERVLRATPVRVLITPPADRGPVSFDDFKKAVRRILVPVDLSPASERQLRLTSRFAQLLSVPLVVAHIIEPTRRIVPGHAYASAVDNERRDRAERRLHEVLQVLPAGVTAETLVAFGDPAEEAAKIAADRRAGLIVIGLHASAAKGTRMGSVTYRVLSLTHGLVLAVPPEQA